MAEYVVLEGIEAGNRFWSKRGDGDPTKLADGTVAYRVLLETDDPAECQRFLYGYAPDYGESLGPETDLALALLWKAVRG